MTTVSWKFDNRDELVVMGAENAEQAWDAAEYFLQEVSEEDETTDYCTGLSGSEGIEPNEDGSYHFRVKANNK